ncbi:MAG: hypothetical protein RLN99_00315 [Kiloniellaceae bacterium]
MSKQSETAAVAAPTQGIPFSKLVADPKNVRKTRRSECGSLCPTATKGSDGTGTALPLNVSDDTIDEKAPEALGSLQAA